MISIPNQVHSPISVLSPLAQSALCSCGTWPMSGFETHLVLVAVSAVTGRAALADACLCVVLTWASCSVLLVTGVSVAIALALGAFPVQEEVAVQAALTSVSVAVVLAVHTHSFIFTRPFCHPGFNLLWIQ